MTKVSHTPEPWCIDRFHGRPGWIAPLSNPDGKSICNIDGGSSYSDEVSEANAQRIVDCVNGCEGVNPAAAPELLQVLESFPGFLAGTEEGDAWIERKNELVAKAKGWKL